MRRNIYFIAFLTVFIPCTVFAKSQARIKELVQIQGVRGNQLYGYGLVVGLNGTGDKTQTVFTAQSLTNMLNKLGIAPSKISKFGLSSSGSEMKVKNVAAVLVTAELPPFVNPGTKIDVTLSSIGDCQSLEGGTLVLTPLQGLNGKIYAVAQGAVSIGGLAANVDQPGHATVGRIPMGAYVEKRVPVTYIENGFITLNLSDPDFTTLSNIRKAIDQKFPGITYPIDSGNIKLKIPQDQLNSPISFMSEIEQLKVLSDSVGKIVINERTGTLVTGEDVSISSVAISHGNLTLTIRNTDPITGQESPDESLENKVLVVPDSISIGQVAKSLNALGASPTDMISIFQAIREAGAIKAKVVQM